MKEQPKILPVLVVGGGPTGLAMGAALAKAGVKARVIEPALSRARLTKALAVQAGTLEAIAETFGPETSALMVQAGLPAKGVEIHLRRGAKPLAISFSRIPSLYNFILMLPQWNTEDVLEDLLKKHGGVLERGKKLISFQPGADFVRCEFELSDGSRDEILAQYVVGCDGAHSLVRKSSNIGFEGSTYQGEFWLGDVEVSGQLGSHEHLQIFLSEDGVAAFFPMGKTQRFRVVQAEADPKAHDDRENIPLEEFEKGAQIRTGLPISFSKPEWLTPFHLNDRLAPRFRKGRVFLAGDAAHIHSPVGGQGMNTGIQDALSLAHKIALKLLHNHDTLDSYEAQRRPVAANVVRFTGLVFRIGLGNGRGWFRRLRAALAPLFLNRGLVQTQIATAVSQVRVARRDIALRKKP